MRRLRVAVSEWIGHEAGSLATIERVDANHNIVEHFSVAGKKFSADHSETCREAARRLRELADRFDRLAHSDCPTQISEHDIVNFSPDTLVGRTLNDADLVAQSHGYRLRIVERNGKSRTVSKKLDIWRINIVEGNGRVAAIKSVG